MSSSEFEEAFLESAREAFRRDPGVASLDSLGVWDLLGELSEAEARTALDCVFRAHGRELASTAALGCLMAHPNVAEDNIDPGAVESLDLGIEQVALSARFGGRATDVFFPVNAVLAVYARENGQGMMFGEETDSEPPPDDPQPEEPKRPGLRVVK